MMAVIRGRVKICTYSADGKELVLNIIDAVACSEKSRCWTAAAHRGRGGTGGDGPAGAGAQQAAAVPGFATGGHHALDWRAVRTPPPDERAPGRRDAARGTCTAGTRSPAPCRHVRREQPDGTRLDIRLSQQQIGNLIGASRESVTSTSLTGRVPDIWPCRAVASSFATAMRLNEWQTRRPEKPSQASAGR